MDANPRQFGLALAEYVVHNPTADLNGEELGAIIYRIRIVEDYAPSDINLISKAMRNLITKLVDVPQATFCSDVWMSMILAIAESAIEDEWVVMVRDTDVTSFAEEFMDMVADVPLARNPSRTSEQIRVVCENLINELGLIRRVFAAFYDTDLEKTMNSVIAENWEEIDIQSDKISATFAIKFLEMRVFETFSMSKDHKKVAVEIYFNTLARMIIRTSLADEDESGVESSFYLFERVLNRLWFDLADEPVVRKYTLIAFNKLIIEGMQCQVDLRCVESFEEACAWLKISTEEICDLQDTLWNCFYSLIGKLMSLNQKNSEVFGESNMSTENWLEKMCQQIPALFDEKSANERLMRDTVDKTRKALQFILEIFMKSTNSEEAVTMMKTTYSELVSAREVQIAAGVKNVYKSFCDRNVISAADQIKLAHDIIKSNSIQEIKAVVSCTPEESDVRQETAKLYFQKLVRDIKDENETTKRKGDPSECISFLVRYLSKETTVEVVTQIIDLLANGVRTEKQRDFAMQIFSMIVETCSPTEFSHREEIGWHLDFQSLNISHESWNNIFTMIAEANLKTTDRKVFTGLTVLSMRQMTSDEMSFKELVYVFKQLGYHKTNYGQNSLVKFYNETDEIKAVADNFISNEHIVKLTVRLLETLGRSILEGDEWQNDSCALDVMFSWMSEYKVMDDQRVMKAVISFCNSIASWQVMTHFGITAELVGIENIYCLSRVWKCDLLSLISFSESMELERKLETALNQYRQVDLDETTSSSSIFRLKENRVPKRTKQELQLLALHNDLSIYMLRLGHDFSHSSLEMPDSEDELFPWVVGVSCGGDSYSSKATEEARQLLLKDKTQNYLDRLHRISVMYYLMMGINNKSPQDCLHLKEYFIYLYTLLLKSDFINLNEENNIKDLDKYMGSLQCWMNECADTEKRSCAFVGSFMRKLGQLFIEIDGSAAEDTSGVCTKEFVQGFVDNIKLLPGWLRNSSCPITFMSDCKNVFDLIFKEELTEQEREKVNTALEMSIDILFHEKSADSLLEDSKYSVQLTDKQSFAAFNIRTENSSDPTKPNLEQYMIRDCLMIFSRYGNAKVLKKIVAKFNNLLPLLIRLISNHEKILDGTKTILDDRHLVFHMMLVTELMEFSMQIAKFLYPVNELAERDFDHLFMTTEDEVISSRSSSKREIKEEKSPNTTISSEEQEVNGTTRCTFEISGRSFITQHWYNCHTCKMTETNGICSVCAVNCHRGHDISYSKLGAFFCDCGSEGCASSKDAKFAASYENAVRGQYPSDKIDENSTKLRCIPPYEVPYDLQLNDSDREELVNQIKILNEQIGKCQPNFERAVNSISKGFENSLNVAEKRQAVLKSLDNDTIEFTSDSSLMEEYIDIPEKFFVVPYRKTESTPGDSSPQLGTIGSNKGKDLSDVIKLENGQEVWVTILEGNHACLCLSYIDTRSSMLDGIQNLRQEIEILPFAVSRISISGTRIVVCGASEVFALRLSATGEAIDRATIKVVEQLGNANQNPVVKAVWCREQDKQLLAVATSQFVRVYDLTLDHVNCVEEMVLMSGNVEDLMMIVKPDGSVQVLVLNSTGYLYENYLSTRLAENNSIFLTNTFEFSHTPFGAPIGPGVSMFYSYTYDLMFVSTEMATCCARIPDSQDATSQMLKWHKLPFTTSVHGWKESDGMISCLSTSSPNHIFYLHIVPGRILIQKMFVKQPIVSQFMLTSSKNEAIYSVMFFADSPTLQMHVTTWNHVRDLWIDDVPSEQVVVEVPEMTSQPQKIPNEELVLLNEGCEILKNVEWQSADLEKFFEKSDLNKRLNGSGIPLTVIQRTRYELVAKIPSTRHVVRGVRIEIDALHGPATLKIENKTVRPHTNVRRFFDVRFDRDESLQIDNRELNIEVRGHPDQEILTIRSLAFIGCDRELMEETKPFYQQLPVLYLPHRFISAFYDLNTSLARGQEVNDKRKKWLIGLATQNLSRRANHPDVAASATKVLKMLYKRNTKGLFDIIDSEMIKEWLYLREWTKEKGMVSWRRKHVDSLLKRLHFTMTRWTLFEALVKRYFLKFLHYVELMREEMLQMSLYTCQSMSTGMIRVLFSALSQTSLESADLIKFFLNLFTDDKTHHLSSDIRSSVQMVIYQYGCSQRRNRERSLEMERERTDRGYVVLKHFGMIPFYGRTRLVPKIEEHRLLFQMVGFMEIEQFLNGNHIDSEFVWLNSFLRKTLDKMRSDGHVNSMPQVLTQMCDSPSYNLTMVAVVLFSQYSFSRLQSHIDYLIKMLKFDISDILPLNNYNFRNFALLRLLEILLGRWVENERKENSVFLEVTEAERIKKETAEPAVVGEKKNSTILLEGQVNRLAESGALELCYEILNYTVPYWKKKMELMSASPEESKKVWLPHVRVVSSSANPPNAEGYSGPRTAEDNYVENITELALRLPMVLHQVCGSKFDENWYRKLCELDAYHDAPFNRHCKKLLMSICNQNMDTYKAMRDKFEMQELMDLVVQKYVMATLECGGHQQLTDIVDVLHGLSNLAATRPEMWRELCDRNIAWLLKLACSTADIIACSVVELLIVAVRDDSGGESKNTKLVDRIVEADGGILLSKIVERFLIGKEETMRWTVHGFLRSIIQLASRQNQAALVKRLYREIFEKSRRIGAHSAQLVDIIATYAPRLFTSSDLVKMKEKEMGEVEGMARRFDTEGYAGKYKQFMELGIGWKGMLLNSNPCLVCFNKKGASEVMKLTAIRSDSRYSSTALIYKLNSNYEINKVSIKLTDVKRTRLIRRVSMYYCPKAVEGVVELKLSPELWRKCAKTVISATDTVINLQLAVPVVTSSIIIEFDDFQEATPSNQQLHCPRCSVPVRTAAGVCENCGENAYQCMKCRAINYVDREPFLCQSCGYCKYARMEISVTCRQLPGTQHITCDAERNQNINEMAKLLVKMENTRSKLRAYKAYCDALWFNMRPLAPFNVHVENNHVKDSLSAYPMLQMPVTSFKATVSAMAHTSQFLKTTHDLLCVQTEQLMALREELRRYDEASEAPLVLYNPQHEGYYSTSENCFGCMCSAVNHSLALLGCLREDHEAHKNLINTPSVFEVVSKLGRDFHILTEECEMLIVKLMIDHPEATRKVERMIKAGKVDRHVFVRSLQTVSDTIWQHKLHYLIKNNMINGDENSNLEVITILNKYLETTRKVRKEVYKKMAERRSKEYRHSARVIRENNRVRVGNLPLPTREAVARWLTTKEEFDACSVLLMRKPSEGPHPVYIGNFTIPQYEWLLPCLFSPFVSVRMAANRLLVNMSRHPGHEGIGVVMMVESLQKLSEVPSDHADQFMFAAHSIIANSSALKTRLFVEKFHVWLINEIHSECQKLFKKENNTLLADYEFGQRLRCYVELLCLMFTGSTVENILLKAAADDLLVILLVSTICLKRMVVRRNRAIDSSRMALEKLLRRVSSKDGAKMMGACSMCLKVMKDTNTLGHVSSVMLEVMDPRREVEESFQIQIEKDAAQDDFLSGRMSTAPYKSTDSGMGPLMRDIKNKICRDTEMIALMDDDTGMELLVCNNIISLNLPVRQVYERVWKRQTAPGEVMLVVYRMRGLLGDAVEPFITSLGDLEPAEDDRAPEDYEQLEALVDELVKCEGVDKLLSLLETTSNSNTSGRFLLGQLRRLFERIVKTSVGRIALVQRRMVPIMMKVIRKCCEDKSDESKMTLGLEFYKVIELLVDDLAVHPFLTGIDEEELNWLLDLYMLLDEDDVVKPVEPNPETARKTTQMLEMMALNIGNIVLGSDVSEDILVQRYIWVFRWRFIDTYENASAKESAVWMAEQLATTTSKIMASEQGNRLKQKILDSGVIRETCSYLVSNHPPLYSPTESAEWKLFLARPSLKLMLNLLQALARNHQASQTEIATTTLPLLHRLEQVASENSIGTMAENVIDALKEDEEVAQKIEAVRQETKLKKRQLAMAMRSKQLSKMGMAVGKGGEVKVSSRKITNEPVLEDDADPTFTCCICRENALSGPKVSAVYAFAAANQIPPERGPNVGTVSQMVLVHLDCHQTAIRRSATGRNVDEWNKASLHNAGARCNVMTPISTGKVPDEAWNPAMTRYLADLGHVCQIPGGISRQLIFIDICKLVDRFIFRHSFSVQSHGGGRESNMQYLGILHLLALSLDANDTDLRTSVPRYRLVSFLFTELTVESWNEQKNDVLKAALNDAETAGEPSTWTGMRPTLLTWAFVDKYFNKVIPITGDDRLEWLRENLRETMHKTSSFVQDYDENVMVIEDLLEYCDVTGADLNEIGQFITNDPASVAVAEAPQAPQAPLPPLAPQAAPEIIEEEDEEEEEEEDEDDEDSEDENSIDED